MQRLETKYWVWIRGMCYHNVSSLVDLVGWGMCWYSRIHHTVSLGVEEATQKSTDNVPAENEEIFRARVK